MSDTMNQPMFGLAPSLNGDNWMSRFDGSTSLAQLTMPGTHDSGALFNLNDSPDTRGLYEFAEQNFASVTRSLKSSIVEAADLITPLGNLTFLLPGGFALQEASYALRAVDLAIPDISGFVNAPLAQAQTLSIKEQLEAGVRFLDFRGRKVDDSLEIYHGPIGQDLDFNEALGDVADFLVANPSETVVVYTQREDGLKVDGFADTPGGGFDLGDRFGLPDFLMKSALNKLGHNISAFLLEDRLPAGFAEIRPDYIEDLRSNFEGASDGNTFASNDAQRNFYALLRDNYGVDIQPITAEDVSSLLASETTWYDYLLVPLLVLQKGAEAVARQLNHVVAEFGLTWLQGQKEFGISAAVQGNDLVLNAATNSVLSYDELLNQYIQEIGTEKFYLENQVPTLDEARGKIVLMVREMAGESRDNNIPLGIDLSAKKDADNTKGVVIGNSLGDPVVITQDFYEPGSSFAKWEAFNSLATDAAAQQDDLMSLMSVDAMYVNYLSATDSEAYAKFAIEDIGPAGYALNRSITIDDVTYQGLNAAFEDVFLEGRPDGRYGSMLIDFIDESMARQIFEMNSAVGSAFALNAALEPTVMRVDVAQDGLTSIQDVSFGLKRVGAETADIILQSTGPGALPYQLDMLDGNWQARESLALSDVARASTDLQAGVYVPIAVLNDGTELAISQVTAHGPSNLEVTFAAPSDEFVAPRAAFKLEGTDAIVVPADTETAVSIEVARLGQFTNGLAFYEAEQGTGAITIDGQTILPGEAGYLQGALSLAKANGTIIRGDQMPEYGESATFDGIDLESGLSYGLLVMHEDNETDLSSSFSSANQGGHAQIVELPGVDGSIWYGIEDLHVGSGVSDRDFNDFLVNVQIG